MRKDKDGGCRGQDEAKTLLSFGWKRLCFAKLAMLVTT